MQGENAFKAYQAALSYLDKADHSMVQVRDHLKKKGFTDADIRTAINKLMEYGFVDDRAFARRFIASHPSSGKLLLRQKLRQKGIDQETAAQALENQDEETQIENALTLLRKKLSGSSEKEDVRKAMQSVMRRGFPYPIVRSAAARYNAEAVEDLYDE